MTAASSRVRSWWRWRSAPWSPSSSAFFPAARASAGAAGGGHARRRHRHERPLDRPASCSGCCSGVPGAAALAPASPGGTSATCRRCGSRASGCSCVFLALIVAAPLAARPASLGLGTPLPRVRGIVGRLAQQNAARNPKRTASTASALMIGLGIVSLFLVVNASLRASLDDTIDNRFQRRPRRRQRAARSWAAGCPASSPRRSTPCPRWTRPPACGSGSPRSTARRRRSAGLDPDTAFDLFDVEVTDGRRRRPRPEDGIGVFAEHGRTPRAGRSATRCRSCSATRVYSRSRSPRSCSTART